MLGYGNIAILVFIFVLGRVWFRHGPKIPLIFIGILAAAYLSFPLLPAIAGFLPLFICLLAIALLLVETVKNNPWR